MARKRYVYKKPKRGRKAPTTDSKARSMQACWRKATGKAGTLTIADAKDIIKSPPSCPYCMLPIPWPQLSIDHIQPKSREGSNEPDNLVWACRTCNITKGDLTGPEFKALLDFLNQHLRMKESVLGRLRMSGAIMGRRRGRK